MIQADYQQIRGITHERNVLINMVGLMLHALNKTPKFTVDNLPPKVRDSYAIAARIEAGLMSMGIQPDELIRDVLMELEKELT